MYLLETGRVAASGPAQKMIEEGARKKPATCEHALEGGPLASSAAVAAISLPSDVGAPDDDAPARKISPSQFGEFCR
jgi:hypothetical protein